MSLQLPTILSPPTPCIPGPTLTVSPQVRSRSCRSPFPGRLPFWASPSLSRLANASGRIEFIIFLIMDWSFASGCSPPRLSATQFPSATDSQCSVRWGLPPHCWCALSGALSEASRFASSKTGANRDGSLTLPSVNTAPVDWKLRPGQAGLCCVSRLLPPRSPPASCF
jgi:hypothetical protein